MEYLALPSFKMLKDDDSEQAIKFKNKLLKEMKVRGKQALEEHRQKLRSGNENQEDENVEEAEETEETEETKEKKEKRQKEKDAWRFINTKCKEFPPKISKHALEYKGYFQLVILILAQYFSNTSFFK
jgi:hypothetical protein